MEKERKITAPEGCEIEKVELIDGVVVVTFREKERKLPKSWEEFCEMFPVKQGEYHIMEDATLFPFKLGQSFDRHKTKDITTLPDHATAEAVFTLCQIIQLRNAYNGGWVPDWTDNESKFTIDFIEAEIFAGEVIGCCTPLFFNTRELRDEFLRSFRPLVEKLKPLYGIKKGGEE